MDISAESKKIIIWENTGNVELATPNTMGQLAKM